MDITTNYKNILRSHQEMDKKQMNWENKQLRNIQQQKEGTSDQYNQEQNENMDRVEKLVTDLQQSSMKLVSPRIHQTWLSYVTELKTHCDYADIKTEKIHIENNRKYA